MIITKKEKKKYQPFVGIGFILIGLYMMLYLKDVKGQIPLILGISTLLWRM